MDAADFDNSGAEGIAITNFDNEMMALYRLGRDGAYKDIGAGAPESARRRATVSGFGCAFLDIDLDGRLDLVAVNGHIDETVRQIHGNVGYAQPPHLFLNDGKGDFRDVAAQAGARFRGAESGARTGLRRFRPRWRRGSSGHHQPGRGVPVSQRATVREPRAAVAPDGNEIESRCDRRGGPRLHARWHAIAHA